MVAAGVRKAATFSEANVLSRQVFGSFSVDFSSADGQTVQEIKSDNRVNISGLNTGTVDNSEYITHIGSLIPLAPNDDGDEITHTPSNDFVYLGVMKGPFKTRPTNFQTTEVMPFILGKRIKGSELETTLFQSQFELRYVPSGLENVSAVRPDGTIETTGVGNFNGTWVDVVPSTKKITSNIQLNVNAYTDTSGTTHPAFSTTLFEESTVGTSDDTQFQFDIDNSSSDSHMRASFMGGNAQYMGVAMRHNGAKDTHGEIAGAAVLKQTQKPSAP